jgi:malate dehydrogenase (oxaloacetate-decarboxylating)
MLIWTGQLIQNHLKEMCGVVYTPTVGDAIQNYSDLFRNPEGCFLNIHNQDHIENILSQFGEYGRNEMIDYIVVTDGEGVND